MGRSSWHKAAVDVALGKRDYEGRLRPRSASDRSLLLGGGFKSSNRRPTTLSRRFETGPNDR